MVRAVLLKSLACSVLLSIVAGQGVVATSGYVSREDNRSHRRSEAPQTSTRPRRRHDVNKNLAKNDDSYLPYWFCPDVTCVEMSSSCSNVEYIVYEPEYLVQGRRVKVRCESCPYCLDMPANLSQQTSRHRRNTRRLVDMIQQAAAAEINECDALRCPEVADGCRDVRLTEVKAGRGRSCGYCPACYDNTLHSASILFS